MKNQKLGIGSISLALVVISFVWTYEIYGICVGDSILSMLSIPTWSNSENASGIHYTVFYSLIFLIPALILAIKYKNDLFARIGKWLSIIFIGIFALSMFFMVV